MCTAPHAETHPPPPIPPFLLAQNLSSKRIAPTDNMRPKLHDEYTHHQVNKYYMNGWTHFSSLRVWFTRKASLSARTPSSEIWLYPRLQNVREQEMRGGSTNPFTLCKRYTQSSLIPRQLFVIYSIGQRLQVSAKAWEWRYSLSEYLLRT